MRKQREKILFTQRGSMARVLFYLNAAFWLYQLLDTLSAMIVDDNSGISVALVGFFLLMNVLALFFSGRLLDQTEKWTYIFALVVIVLNIALAFTGVPDILYVTALIVDVVILLVLFSLRKLFFK
jgi:hypothetical protein